MARILDPTAVHAILATKWSGSSAGGVLTRKVESFTVETAIDADADEWDITIGNPDGALNSVLARDNEVRVQIYGAGKGAAYLITGIMDEAKMTEQGSLQLTGRDVSSIPVDSAHYPQVYRAMRPDQIIMQEAQALHMTSKFKLMPTFAKIERTDGSESYWDFWYRMIRKEGQWLWTLPDGTLVSSDLKNAALKYRFGSRAIAAKDNRFLPILNYEFRKSTQKRFGEVAIHWRKNSADVDGQITFAQDATTADWYKQPLKIVEDSHIGSLKEAIKIGNEEVYESKVGAVELVVTIGDPGALIETNCIAQIEIPEEGISGKWFVVGTICRGDGGGFVQDVRLREPGFALSKHKAADPTDPETTPNPSVGGGSDVPVGKLKANMGAHPEWWPCFEAAAHANNGIVDYNLFLATLLAIANHETGFTNVRAHIGMDNKTPAPGGYTGEWYNFKEDSSGSLTEQEWLQAFSNIAGRYAPVDFAVGPMQLGASGAKQIADDKFKPNYHDQWYSGRWDACSNIWGGAAWLAGYVARACGSKYSDACFKRALDGYGYSGFGDELWPKIQEYLQMVQEYYAPPPSTTPGTSDTAAAYAEQLLNYMRTDQFRVNSNSLIDQLKKIRDGKKLRNQCGEDVECDPNTLGWACWMIQEKNYFVGFSSLCEDHSCYVKGTNRESAHPQGRACDVGQLGRAGIGWYRIGAGTKVGRQLIIEVMDAVEHGPWTPSQVICNGDGRFDPVVQAHQWNGGPTNYITGDHTDHIHIGY